MKIDVFSSAGVKTGSLELPSRIFDVPVNKGLIHLAVVRQQSNRRRPIAHVKTRGEVAGSTKKLFQQKGTGNARRGPIRSPVMRGGGKAFGPRNEANFQKDMPKKMRRKALFCSLSLRAKEGAIVGLESYPDTMKTKTFVELLKKMNAPIGRRIVVVTAGEHSGIELSARNVPRVKTLAAAYLNPEDIMLANRIIFLSDAVKAAEDTFVRREAEEVENAKKADKPSVKNPKKPTHKEKSSDSSSPAK